MLASVPQLLGVAGLVGDRFSFSSPHVVRHRESGRLWACCYSVRDDDSDYDCSTNWWEVEAKTES